MTRPNHPCAGPAGRPPRPADPPRRPPARRQRPVAGHAGAGLVLPAVHRGLAARAGGDPVAAPLALVALHPGRPRLDRRRAAGRDRPRGGPAAAHLRAPALLAVRGPALRLRPPGTRITISQFLWDLVATQVWLAVPVGLLAASLSVWNAERAAGGAEWSPFVRRRQRIDQRTRDRKTARLVAQPRDHKLTAPALGIALDGDLASWRQGRYVVPPAQLRGKAMAVVGAPGAGKTVTLLRLAYLAGLLGRKVCFVDCKGTDPTLVPALIAAYRLGNPGARVGCWPDTAMDMWRGTPSRCQPAARGRAVHRAVLPAGRLRRPPPGPDRPRHAAVDGSDELLRRLDVDELAALWEGRPSSSRTSRPSATTSPAPGCATPTSSPPWPAPSTAARWSYEDVDLAVLTVPTLLSKAEADAAMRVVLEDYGHYATGRKPREGEDALLVLDEFSALASGVDSAINLAERVRDVGVQVVVAAQASRASATTARPPGCWPPVPAGSWSTSAPTPSGCWPWPGQVRVLEHNWELDFYGPRGLRQGPHGGPAQDRPRGRPPGPARRGLGDPGRPDHPPARAATARRGA